MPTGGGTRQTNRPGATWATKNRTKTKLLKADFAAHKFRPGEYYDRYLDKLLKKHCLSLVEYWAGNELLGV